MKLHRLHLVWGTAVLLWLALVIAWYYAGHKPFSVETASSIGGAAGSLLIGFSLLSLAGGLGRRLLGEFSRTPLVNTTLQGALGLGLLSTAALILGAVLGISPVIAWSGLVIGSLLLLRNIIGWWRSWSAVGAAWIPGDHLSQVLAVLAGLIAACALIIALAPPIKFDALVYHLALPRAYLQAGRVVYIPWNFFWGMPQLVEMLYTWSMQLAGETAAACLTWGAGILALAGILGIVQDRYGQPAGWVAVAGLLAGATTASGMGWGYVEWFTILYGAAFLAALQIAIDRRSVFAMFIAGAFAGFAAASKYTAGALLLAGTVTIIWNGWRTGPRFEAFRQTLVFISGSFTAFLPWLLKNLAATGSPLYPFLFPAGAVSAYRLGLYQSLPAWGDWRDVLFLPLRATGLGFEGAPGYAASIGPLLLGLGMIYPLRRWIHAAREIPGAGAAVPVAISGLLIWAVAARLSGLLVQSRLYMSFFPAFALIAAGGYVTLSAIHLPGVRPGRIAGSLVALALALNAVQVGLEVISRQALPVLAGQIAAGDYLAVNLGWVVAADQAIRELPGGSRAVLLWEPRSLYCLPGCDPDEVLDRWLVDLHEYQTPDKVLAAWRDAGYSHLLVNQQGADFVQQEDRRYTPAHWQALQDLTAMLPAPRQTGGGYLLYSLEP